MVAFSYPEISLYSLKPISNSLMSVALVIYLSCFIKVVKGDTVDSYKSACKNGLMSLILANQKLSNFVTTECLHILLPRTKQQQATSLTAKKT